MKALGLSLLAVMAIAPVGCGGDDGNSDQTTDNGGDDVVLPDAPKPPDATPMPDAFVLPPGCDAAELDDANNDAFDNGTPEATGLTFTTSTTVCGTINNGHFITMSDALMTSVADIDVYSVTIPADTKVFVSLTGDANLGTVANAQFAVIPLQQGIDGSVGGGYVIDRAVGAALLPAGEWGIVVASIGGDADNTVTAPYKLKMTVDTTPNCAAGTTPTATLTEGHDGATNDGNNVIQIDENFVGTLTPSTTDTPEASTPVHTTTATSVYTITGTSTSVAAVAASTNPYWDGDTYEFTTGATANQARIRLNWPATTPEADIDFLVYEKPAAGAPLGPQITGSASTDPEEFVVSALKPATTYWVFVGGYRSSAAATATPAADGFPKTYTLQVCGDSFTAP